jgi:hypothetical protein
VKRICLLGAVVAGLFIIGGTTALATTKAAGSKKKSAKSVKPTPVTTNVTCNLNLTQQVPAGSVTVTQGATDGTQYGNVGCGTPLGKGVESNSFRSDSGGTLSGPYQQYFNSGTVYGDYVLAPDDSGPPTTTSFASSSYTGTVTIKNGHGLDGKATGKGTLTCLTTDSVHYSCIEKVKLTLPGR